MGIEASSEAAFVTQAELRTQHRTAQAYTDEAAPESDSGIAASSAEASPETLTLRSCPSLSSDRVVSGPGPCPGLVSASASRAADTAVNPAPVALQALCETGAVRAGVKSLGTGVGKELASGASVGILGAGIWVRGDVCRSSILESGHGYGRLSLPVYVLNWVCLSQEIILPDRS